MDFHIARAFGILRVITSSIRLPVSIKAVAIIVMSRLLRHYVRHRRSVLDVAKRWRPTPPVKTLPEAGMTVL